MLIMFYILSFAAFYLYGQAINVAYNSNHFVSTANLVTKHFKLN